MVRGVGVLMVSVSTGTAQGPGATDRVLGVLHEGRGLVQCGWPQANGFRVSCSRRLGVGRRRLTRLPLAQGL